MEHRPPGEPSGSVYREYAPRAELRDYVRALFWFGPAGSRSVRRSTRAFTVSRDEWLLTPVIADGHPSLIFELGWTSRGDDSWTPAAAAFNATVMGPVTRAARSPGTDRAASIGVYLRPRAYELLRVPASELTDQIVPLSEIWKSCAFEPSPHLSDEDVVAIEEELMRRLRISQQREHALAIAEIASRVHAEGGRITVGEMARFAGLSRPHFTRRFKAEIGMSPKLYARLARFRAALRFANARNPRGSWAPLATACGYVDQSHLIAEFREFSGLTPQQLVRDDRFHPFVGEQRKHLEQTFLASDGRMG